VIGHLDAFGLDAALADVGGRLRDQLAAREAYRAAA
jgi:hypothetical protein